MKSLFASKTLWANMIVIGLAALVGINNCEVIAAYPEAVAWIGSAIGVMNVILRLVTKEPIR